MRCSKDKIIRSASMHESDCFSGVLFRLLHQCHGTSAVEFAILLALVVTGILFAVQSLTQATKGSLEEIVLVTPDQPDSKLPPTSIELKLTKSEPNPGWLANNQRQIERSVIVLLLLACLFMLRRQRRAIVVEETKRDEAEAEKDEQLQVFLKRQEIYRTLSTNIDSLFNSQMQVQHLISKQVSTVRPHTPVSQMKELMSRRQLRHLLVCDNEKQLVGIISDRDLHREDTATAQQVMSQDLITVPPDARVSTVISLILKEKISALPIISEGKIHGLITTTDLIMAMQCTLKLWHEAASAIRAESTSASNSSEQADNADSQREPELVSV